MFEATAAESCNNLTEVLHSLRDDTFDFDTTRASWIFEVRLQASSSLLHAPATREASRAAELICPTFRQDDERIAGLGDEPYSDKTTVKRT